MHFTKSSTSYRSTLLVDSTLDEMDMLIPDDNAAKNNVYRAAHFTDSAYYLLLQTNSDKVLIRKFSLESGDTTISKDTFVSQLELTSN